MNTKKLNVLSLFDGVGSAYIALQRAGLAIENYYSCEIDKSAIKVLQHHHSGNTNFHFINDIKDVDGNDYAHIDLVIFGSPCTQLTSVNPKDRRGLDGPDSKLFFLAVEILKTIKRIGTKEKMFYFLMENVASMPNKDRDIITNELKSVFGESVGLLKIDSAVIGPAHRRRYYWTNIPNIEPLRQKNVRFQDILVNGYADRAKANVLLTTNVTLTKGIYRFYTKNIGNIVFKDKTFSEFPVEEKLLAYPKILKETGYIGKANVLEGEYDFPNGCYRLPSVLELERAMTFPDGYISGVPGISKTEKKKLIGLSFTVDVVSNFLKPLQYQLYNTNKVMAK